MKRAAKLNGIDKAAILLSALGPEQSASIVREMDDAMLVRIGQRMSELSSIDSQLVHEVVESYLEVHMADKNRFGKGRKDVVALLERAVDDERAQRLLSSIDEPPVLNTWQKLSRQKPENIANLLKGEQAQTIAVILGKIDGEVACRALELLPDALQLSVVESLSRIEHVSDDLVREIEEAIAYSLDDSTEGTKSEFDGIGRVVELLKGVDKKTSKVLMNKLTMKDRELSSRVDKLLLAFDDLVAVSDRDIQTVLKHISSEALVRALKGATDDVRDRFFKNMSSRAAELMREDMEAMPPLKLSDVEDSQQQILKVVKKLDADGLITLNTDEML